MLLNLLLGKDTRAERRAARRFQGTTGLQMKQKEPLPLSQLHCGMEWAQASPSHTWPWAVETNFILLYSKFMISAVLPSSDLMGGYEPEVQSSHCQADSNSRSQTSCTAVTNITSTQWRPFRHSALFRSWKSGREKNRKSPAFTEFTIQVGGEDKQEITTQQRDLQPSNQWLKILNPFWKVIGHLSLKTLLINHFLPFLLQGPH